MNVKFINIDNKYFDVLVLLNPTYAVLEGKLGLEKFITTLNVDDLREKESIGTRCSNCVIITKHLFDEIWDLNRIKEEVLKFAKEKLKSRKRNLPDLEEENILEDVKQFLFFEEEDDESIEELFRAFGSKSFIYTFLKISQKVPVPILIASMYTFIGRIVKQHDSIFYKRMALLYRDNIVKNFTRSYENYRNRNNDELGLSFVKFLNDLV